MTDESTTTGDRDRTASPRSASGRSRGSREPTAAEVVAGLPVPGTTALDDELLRLDSPPGARARRENGLGRRKREPVGKAVSAQRRAELIAAAAALAAADTASAPAPKRQVAVARFVVLGTAVVVSAAVLATLTLRDPATALSRADASFMTGQLLTVDQRVRTQLARIRFGTAPLARIRARDAIDTTRSLELQIQADDGGLADSMRAALRAEREWLDAVGSTLANPRSILREQLVARERRLLATLATLPGYVPPDGEASRRLLRFSRSRSREREGSRERGSRRSGPA